MIQGRLVPGAYLLLDAATFVYLMVMDAPDINAWNWLLIVPINLFLAQIWPIYWIILHWIA
ncbi:hypothetical protein ORIO_02130 [Cereibacter azotoformans]|uniref:hypothetical protein n=1 Tax=Cereibacter azotoformans TaxID=43057 RepID=UPI0005C76181|nr:hypothetical protein [Cereibacter azotoformans]ULB08734.1 hypothetical protein ORIO_02130 [Cereibacter azotoformans]